MDLHELKPAPGATHHRKRVGRGNGSGHGTTSTRGHKGQKARAGGGVSPRFEGGQLPLVKRMPHLRGFTNIFRVNYAAVNLSRLAKFPAGATVDPAALAAARIISSPSQPVKILGTGDLDRPLTISAHRFSGRALEKIKAAGGQAIQLEAPKGEGEAQPESAPGEEK